jgi:stage II sporulation protein D
MISFSRASIATLLKRSALVFAGALACASAVSGGNPPPRDGGDQPVRIALGVSTEPVNISGTGSWNLYNRNSEHLLFRARPDERVSVSARGGRLVATRETRGSSSAQTGPLVVRAVTPGSFVTYGGKRYRGELLVQTTDSGILVVNRLSVESYLRGVVPLEIGNRQAGEEAAVEAQAVAARSYSYIHMAKSEGQAFDMYATVQDQVYGGVDAEKPIADAAIASTNGMVLRYGGRIVNTLYHSTCGGSTAEVQEVWWREPNQPYLQRVSDRIPGTDKFYCDPSPRFRWTVAFDRAQLRATLEKYLSQYSPAPSGSLGSITAVRIDGRTPSDRVASMTVQTSGGSYTVRGNDVRFVFRPQGTTILNSTYFTAESRVGPSGEVESLTLNGGGYGHGIGMCQWGAIGRARAGQNYRTILTTYYPGTTVGRID